MKLFQQYGHEAVDVRDIGLRGAMDEQIASHAQKEGLCLVTGDFDFSDIRNYPPRQYAGIIVLNLPKNSTVSFILNLVKNLLEQKDLLQTMSGKLAIVESSHVRIRKD